MSKIRHVHRLSLDWGRAAAEAIFSGERGKHFVLVHGACHGAWCWYKVATLLRSSGHNVTMIDLAASGINPIQASSLLSISDYFKPLRDVMEGHSFGGLALSHVIERYPKKIAVAVFVTALMPGPILNITMVYAESSRRTGSLGDIHYSYDKWAKQPADRLHTRPNDWTLANTLMRPQRLFNDEDMTREITLSEQNYGSVRRVAVISEDDKLIDKDFFFNQIGASRAYQLSPIQQNYGSVRRVAVISEDDKLIDKDFMLWMIERNPPDQVLEVKGSDHMVMMSKPMRLLALLQHIANITHY
ncbi:hypothetical protein EUGRSUZ_I01202 [Eucalyptus grandis]|uniref:AB hydrolase-1 domain-containing protein n=2 Tax=Eucalyptus grandis TaxID=71139 RepID=A0A059APD3_EUCGR|nr:hypothetical protein EUGRSUZ_I01202 [Eucalyptus grandis]